MIGKLTRTMVRTFAFALALCATTSAWALNSLEETGGFVMPAAQLAFKDVALSEIVSGSVRCRMLGSSINDDGKEAVTCFYDTSHLEDASPYVTCEAQMYDDPSYHYVKGVILEFTQVGSDIYVKSKGTCYKQYSGATTPGGESIATSNYSAGATGYSINHIRFMNRDTLPSRSINVNFYENVKRVSTTDDVGLLESAVPGNLWDNVFIENTTTPASVQVLGTDKVRSSSDGLAVSISGTRGAYWPSNADSSYTYDVRAGYIDDNYDNSTPTVTVVNIPFKYYRVYVYHSNDTVGRKFGYDTINGVNYYYNRGGPGTFNHGVYLSIGTGSWGGASITDQYEGANCLVSPVISGSTLTIVGHSDISSDGKTATYRAGFAAIQVVEVKSPVKPLAIWNGDFKVNYTRGPISFSYNGHTVADDGSKVTVVSGTQNKGGVRFLSDTGYSKLGAVAALGNVQKSASGVCGLMGIRSSNNDYRTWLGLQSNKYDLGSWKNGGGSDTSNSAWAYPSDGARHYFGIATEHIGADSNGSGTFGYLDGNSTPILRNAFSDKDDRDLSRLNGIAAGGYWGNGGNEWICPGSTLHYIAVFNSSDAETVNYWSLTGMTSAENVALTDGEGSLSGGSGVGVNLNGGRVTVSGATVAAALFVQADTTLVFEDGDASLEISGPLYIADGKTLTIEVLEDANCVAGTAYTKDLITAEDYFTENSTITVTQLPDVDAGSETASVEGPISWSYEPDVVPVWNNGAWDVNPTASTKVIKINSSSGATYNAGGDYTTVYVIGTGTQPIGEDGLTAGTLVIESGASINMANVTATTVVGEGTAIYTLGTSGGYVTSEEKPFTDSRWTGTVELKDCYINAIVLQHYGNSGSTVRANNLNGYLKANTEDIAEVKAVEIGTGGFTLNNGLHSQRWVFSAAITGTGDFKVATSSNASSGTISQFVFIGDMDGFGGNLNFGTLTSAEPEIIIAPDKASIPAKANYDSSATRAKISILSGASATIASGKTWSTSSRGSDYPNWQVDGTLRIKGSIYGGAGGAGSQWCRCQGTGTVIFDGKFPGGSEYGEAWWNGTYWAGTLEITNATTTTAIYLQQLGSSQSTVRFSGFTGPMKSGGNSIKAVEIGPAGWTLNGTFAPTIPADLRGPGVLTVSTTGDSAKTITFSGDVSAFAGKVAFSGDQNSRVLLGAASTGRAMSKSVIIGEGATCVMGQAWDSVYYDIYVDGQLTVGKRLGTFNAVEIGQSGALEVVSDGFVWASNGLTVDGTMTAPKYADTYFGGGTTITVNSTGVFELGANAGNVDVNGVSHAKITGTGTIKFPSDSTGYYTIPSSADKMFATTLSVINDNAKALIVTFKNDTSAVTTNRNMHGSGSYRSDWGSGTSRGLLALQDKNTEWSGTFWTENDHRITEFIVAGVDGASQKTLKLSGTQVAAGSTPLTVESAGSANLTGTWYGNATVDGTFGGTGTLTGNLTFNAGSTFKAFASDTDGLSVSSTTTFENGAGDNVNIDVSDIVTDITNSGITLISSTGTLTVDVDKLTVTSGYFCRKEDNTLKVYPVAATVTKSDDSVVAFETVQAAVDASATSDYSGYKYVTIWENTSFIPVDGVKYKIADGVTATPISGSPEYAFVANDADANGAVTYNKENNPTTYTWKADAATNYWQLKTNWKNSADQTADRVLIPTDSVVINVDRSSNPIQITAIGTTIINAISVGNTVTLTASNTDKTLTVTESVVLTTETSTLTISGTLSLAGTVTTTVADKCVKWVYGESSKTYSVCDPVAEIGGVKYGSLANAIEVATDAGLASITVTDSTAEVPDGYYLINEGSGIARYQAAIVDENTDVHYYATVDGAVTDFLGLYLSTKTYDHFEIYSSTNVVVNVNAASDVLNNNSLKIKCTEAGVSATLSPTTVEYEFVAGDPDESGIITYTRQEKATTYVWVGTTATFWARTDKWKIGMAEGATATRVPAGNDTVILNDGAAIIIRPLDSNVNVSAMVVSGDVKITSTSDKSIAVASSINLATADASLKVSGVTISPYPTTSVAGRAVSSSSYYIGEDYYTEYSVGSAAAEIDGTGYASLALAIAAASDNDTITLSANCSESVNLGGKSITLDEGAYTFTGSFTGNGTLALPDGTLLKSPSPDRWASGWTGTVWLRNYTDLTGTSQQGTKSWGSTNFEPNNYGNSNSTVRFTGVKGYLTANDDGSYTIQPALELVDDGDTPGLLLYNGWGYNANANCHTVVRELKGSGTLAADTTLSGGVIPGLNVLLQVRKWDNFTGTLNMPNKNIVFGSTLPAQSVVEGGGHIFVQSGAVVTVPTGKTWTAANGFVVSGAIKSEAVLTVTSGDASMRLSEATDGDYHVYVLVPSPAEVTTTTFNFNAFTYGDLPVTLGDGDTIIVPSNCTGDEWHPSLSNAAGHPVIVRKEMNWKAGIGTMRIDSGVTVYAYGGSDGSVVNDGAVISGDGALQLQNTVSVNGAASITCSVTGSGAFSLANKNATLTVPSALDTGMVTTSVTGAKVISELVDVGTRYRVVYGTIFSVY